MFAGSGTTMAFTNDIYTYTTSEQLPAGTYYVTVQALSKDEQILDSKVSSAMEIVLTDEEAAPDFSDEYSVAKTELWKDRSKWICLAPIPSRYRSAWICIPIRKLPPSLNKERSAIA